MQKWDFFFLDSWCAYEQSLKIKECVKISFNRELGKQILSLCAAVWCYCFLTLKWLLLMKSCFGMRDTDYSPFLGQHIISVQVPYQWPTSKHAHTLTAHTLQGKLSFNSLIWSKTTNQIKLLFWSENPSECRYLWTQTRAAQFLHSRRSSPQMKTV